MVYLDLYFVLGHKERVQDRHIIGEHVDVQFMLILEIVQEVSQSHLRAVSLETRHIDSVP